MGLARKTSRHEQSAREQDAGARHPQKPPMIRAPRGLRSNGDVGRNPIRAAALPESRDIDVDWLQRLDSLPFRPPDQVFI